MLFARSYSGFLDLVDDMTVLSPDNEVYRQTIQSVYLVKEVDAVVLLYCSTLLYHSK